jgi:hypothetical protein
VLEPERRQLLQILPELPLPASHPGVYHIPSRPNGGACQLLRHHRCGAHAQRPFPCRTFPIVVHFGWGVQASLVLSCPGLDLRTLSDWTIQTQRAAPRGLDSELSAVRSELRLSRSEALVESAEGSLRVAIDRMNRRGVDLDDSLTESFSWADLPGFGGTYLTRELPTVDEGLENLPMTFDPKYGRVAFASEGDAWRLLSLREEGGVETELGTYLADGPPPVLGEDGRALLRGYIRYALARHLTLGQLMLELEEFGDASLVDGLDRTRREIASDVVTRAVVLARLHGQSSDRLGADEIEAGIRATDAEWVDRPTAGLIL